MDNILIQSGQNDKEVFVNFYNFIRAKATRKNNIEILLKTGSSLKNETSRREHSSMSSLAIDFCALQSVMNLSCANWDNIKRAIKLYRHVVKSDIVGAPEYIEDLSCIWEKGMSCHRYNSILGDSLKRLKKTYSMSTSKTSDELDSVIFAIEKLSEEEKMFILSNLANELKINLPESHL